MKKKLLFTLQLSRSIWPIGRINVWWTAFTSALFDPLVLNPSPNLQRGGEGVRPSREGWGHQGEALRSGILARAAGGAECVRPLSRGVHAFALNQWEVNLFRKKLCSRACMKMGYMSVSWDWKKKHDVCLNYTFLLVYLGLKISKYLAETPIVKGW